MYYANTIVGRKGEDGRCDKKNERVRGRNEKGMKIKTEEKALKMHLFGLSTPKNLAPPAANLLVGRKK